MCGVVDGGIVAGLYGYEAGQSGRRRHLRVVRREPGARRVRRGRRRGRAVRPPAPDRPRLPRSRSAPTGWSRSTGTPATGRSSSTTSCPGVVVGQTLATRPEQGYRALLEATAFGTRVIVETFAAAGVPVTEFIVAGGLLTNPQLMQTYADVLRLPISTIASEQGPALGSAIHAAVAAGAYPDVRAAAAAMGAVNRAVYTPNEARRRRLRPALRRVPAAARLVRARRQRADEAAARRCAARRSADGGRRHDRRLEPATVEAAVADVRAEVAGLHAELVRYGLVVWTAGNVSGRVPGADLFVIKPSGVPYDDLSPDSMILCDLDGNVVPGTPGSERSPSSDTAAHAYVYRHLPEVGGVVHTHSTYAVAWAARGEEIPCVITGMADEFGGPIPVGPFAVIGDDSIGRGIVETLRGHRSRAVLMRNHGPFTIGVTARDAVKAAVHGRGRRPHRAHRPAGRRRSCRSRRTRSTASTTATRTSTARPPTTAASPQRRRSIRPERENRHATRTARAPTLDGLRGLVRHRQPDAVRRGDAAPGRRAVPAGRARARRTCPVRVVWKPVLTDPDGIRRLALDANARDEVIGVIAWMHTFSPAKMWIAGLDALRKPLLHLHTQANVELPVGGDRLRLHEPQPGGARRPRVRLPPDPAGRRAQDRRRATCPTRRCSRAGRGLAAGGGRLGGRPVAQARPVRRQHALRRGHRGRQDRGRAAVRRPGQHLGRQRARRGGGRGAPTPTSTRWSPSTLDLYDVAPELLPGGERHQSLRDGAAIELGLRSFLEGGGFGAFTTSFEDLGALTAAARASPSSG